jgi:glutamate-1-semialdehyde aminotransferase
MIFSELRRPGKLGFGERIGPLRTKEGIVPIFEEIICGYRMRPGTAQAYYGATPDLTTLAKAIGGGILISAYPRRSAKKRLWRCVPLWGGQA